MPSIVVQINQMHRNQNLKKYAKSLIEFNEGTNFVDVESVLGLKIYFFYAEIDQVW